MFTCEVRRKSRPRAAGGRGGTGGRGYNGLFVGTARLRIEAPRLPPILDVKFVLSDPPAGLSLEGVGFEPDALLLYVKADSEKAKVGHAGNLIVEAYLEREVPSKGAKGKASRRKTRYFIGVLPAIPIVLVAE